MTKLTDLSPGARRTRVAQLVANPRTRAALPDKYLTSGQLKQRQLNQRLNAPVTPGSPLTNRGLAKQRDAAMTVEYGPQEQAGNAALAASRQTERDQGAWYDAYLAELRQHQGNTAGINTQADTAFKNLTGAVGKLGTGVEGTNAQGDAANAQAVRQQLLAGFGGLQGEVGRSSNAYADTLSHVVGPGQKLTAQAQGRRNTDAIGEKLTELAKRKGAAAADYTAKALTNEQNRTVAISSLTNKDVAQQSTADYRKAQIDLKRGVDPVTGKPLPKDKKAPTGYGPNAPGMNKYGYTYDEWTALSATDQAKARAGKTPAKGKGATGPDWLTQQQMGAGLSQLADLKTFAQKAKNGEALIKGHGRQPKLNQAQAAAKLQANAVVKDPVLVTAAVEAVYVGNLSADTIRSLIAAGYKPSRVAKTLGVLTAGQMPYRGPDQAPGDRGTN